MEIIYNPLSPKHEGKNYEIEKRFGNIENLVKTPKIKIPNGEKFLHLGHSPEYIQSIKEASEKTGEFCGTHFSPESYKVATEGVGLSILGAENGAFVLTRPPGHHAGYNLPDKKVSLGNCVFNNMAIAAKHLRNNGNKVFILDIDLHYGNGTQEILGNEEDIFVFDISRECGWPNQNFEYNNCFNLRFKKGTENKEYLEKSKELLISKMNDFNPDIIGVSAGFDTYIEDAIYCDVKNYDKVEYFELTKKSSEGIKEIISPYPHFAILEGGYSPVVVKEGVEAFTKYKNLS